MLSPLAERAIRRTISATSAHAGGGRATMQDAPLLALDAWIEQNFYLYDTGALITLHDTQRRALIEARAMDGGMFRYATVLWSWPKKSAKSSVIAAVVDYQCTNFPRSSVKLIANDLKQADSRVGHYLRESIKLSAKHDPERAAIKIKPSGYLIEYPNGSRVEMVPIDPAGEAGGNDDLLVYSELHGWKSNAHQRMWSEMTLSPNKFGRSQRWIDTYAGYSGESPILENLYNQGVNEGAELWEPGSEVYVNAVARLLCVWITRHLLPWQINDQGKAYYAQESASLLPREYNRMHCNQWVTSADVFVPPEWWDACRGDVPDRQPGEQIIVGIDAAVSGDCFGIVAVTRHGEQVYVRYSRTWKPPKGGKIEYVNQDNPDDVTYPEGELRRLAKEYNVVQFAYDPHQLHDLATRLTKVGLGWFREFKQGDPRLVADKQLYDAIRERRITHDGAPELAEHVKNANSESLGNKEQLRIVKRADHLKIDACVALSMAHAEARRLNIG